MPDALLRARAALGRGDESGPTLAAAVAPMKTLVGTGVNRAALAPHAGSWAPEGRFPILTAGSAQQSQELVAL